MSESRLKLGAVLFPGFELLDMFGPLEMFAVLGAERVDIRMLAETTDPVPSAMHTDIDRGPKVAVDSNFQSAGDLDILLVPGGFGTRVQLENPTILEFIGDSGRAAGHVCSVCTGALLLAQTGLLDGYRATTNKQFFGLSECVQGDVQWVEQARWVEDGKFFTSSGVSAGMDMALALIHKLFGADIAQAVADGTEYTWHRDADTDPFTAHLNEGLRAMAEQTEKPQP